MANPFFSDAELTALRDAPPALPDVGYGPRWFEAQKDRPLYLFGCGGLALGVQSLLSGSNIKGYLDNDPDKQNTVMHGLPVYAPSAIRDRIGAENALVVISIGKPRYAREIRAQCDQLGFACVEWTDCWPYFAERDSLDALAENSNIQRAMDLWDDEKSRTVFRRLVRFRTTFSRDDCPEVTEPQYFIDEIPASARRNFVDAGAYDGDTLRTYLSCFGNDFAAYHAFEPLPECQERLRKAAVGNACIHIHPVGLADFNGACGMIADGTSSRLDESGANADTVTVARLDDVLGDAVVGMIKMDIEGAEPAALRGAESILRRQRPVLAICVYHEPDHLWAIPEWIRDLDLGYRLLLRQHSPFAAETVCYAIPEERFREDTP